MQHKQILKLKSYHRVHRSLKPKALILVSYCESSLPNRTGISGPPQIETASAPATAIMSAHDTGKRETN